MQEHIELFNIYIKELISHYAWVIIICTIFMRKSYKSQCTKRQRHLHHHFECAISRAHECRRAPTRLMHVFDINGGYAPMNIRSHALHTNAIECTAIRRIYILFQWNARGIFYTPWHFPRLAELPWAWVTVIDPGYAWKLITRKRCWLPKFREPWKPSQLESTFACST